MRATRAQTIDAWTHLIDEGRGYSNFVPGEYRRILEKPVFHNFCGVLLRHVVPGSEVLEAGCGSAFYSFFLAGHGARVTAIDINEKLISELTNLRRLLDGDYGSVELIAMDLFQLGELRRPFDLIFNDGTYQHFLNPDDRAEMLQIFRRSLRDGGKCIIAVPHLGNIFYHASLDEKVPAMQPFSFQSLERELNRGGFRVTETGYKFVNPGFDQWLKRRWLKGPIRAVGRVFGALPRPLQGLIAPHMYCVAEKRRD